MYANANLTFSFSTGILSPACFHTKRRPCCASCSNPLTVVLSWLALRLLPTVDIFPPRPLFVAGRPVLFTLLSGAPFCAFLICTPPPVLHGFAQVRERQLRPVFPNGAAIVVSFRARPGTGEKTRKSSVKSLIVYHTFFSLPSMRCRTGVCFPMLRSLNYSSRT